MASAYIKGQRIALNPAQVIGKGGEADVYDIGGSRALKIYKTPDHPDYVGNPQEQLGAKLRLEIHQKKLPAFPKNLPPGVISPIDLATNQNGQKIVGYSMTFLKGAEVLLRYAERNFRQAGVSNEMVIEIFRDLHQTTRLTHRVGVVIGDNNDLNVLVTGTKSHLIDADSFQFGPFFCQMFTMQFVDPLLCDSHGKHLNLIKPHTVDSDWYAYSVMLMKCLLYVDPYGGVYRPKDPKKRINHGERPLSRITVFHPEVVYPKPATPYGVLPDGLLQFFHLTFEKDKRGEFPLKLIENIRWTKCIACGTEHARGICPHCSHYAPQAVKLTVRGKVTATNVFRTDTGLIAFATLQGRNLRYLYHENGEFKREGDKVVLNGAMDPQMRFRLQGNQTLIAKGHQLITFQADGSHQTTNVDTMGNLPIFDANENHAYWTNSGQLVRDGVLGNEVIGDVLSGQTLFWVGPKFGFGFYRAGELSVAFTFDAVKHGINDQVKLPKIRGQVIDSTCVFTENNCWFFISTREAGQTINRCYLIKNTGVIEANAETTSGDGTWLGTIRGKCAAGSLMFAPTDDGIVRLEAVGDKILETSNFPDTEPFVDSSTHLFAGSEGIFAVGRREITKLTISP